MHVDEQLYQPIVEWLNQRIANDTLKKHAKKIKHEKRHAYSFTHLTHRVDSPGLITRNRQLIEDGFPMDNVLQINQAIKQYYGLPEDLPNEALFGCMLSSSTTGHVVHEHKDDSDLMCLHHVRFNVMLSKPTRGGNPVMSGQEHEVAQGKVWACEASNVTHKTSEIHGTRWRHMLSAGFDLTDDQLIHMRQQVLEDGDCKCFDDMMDHTFYNITNTYSDNARYTQHVYQHEERVHVDSISLFMTDQEIQLAMEAPTDTTSSDMPISTSAINRIKEKFNQ